MKRKVEKDGADGMEDMMMANKVTDLSTGGTIILLFVCGIITFWLIYLCLQKHTPAAPLLCVVVDDDPSNNKKHNDSIMFASDDADTKSTSTTNETTPIDCYCCSTKTNDIL
jgi:hypothetical protein